MAEVLQQPDLAVLAKVDRALEGLPANQLVWLSGYLYGLSRSGVDGVAAPVTTAPPLQTAVSVLYGSQTGNARRLAERAGKQLGDDGFAVTLTSLAKLRARDLAKLGHALFVVSTQGDGEPAEDARDFYTALAGDSAPKLKSLRFAVLGLGDSSYPKFNEAGRWLEQRLLALGATASHARLEGDLDFERHTRDWLGTYTKTLPTPQAAQSAVALSSTSAMAQASPDQPAVAELLTNQRITARGALRDVRHLEFAIDPATLAYEPGDAFGVRFENPPELVEPLLERLGGAAGTTVSALGQSRPLEQWLRSELEISKVSRPLLKALAASGRSKLAAELLETSVDTLQTRLRELQPIDLLKASPDALTPAELIAALMPLKGRLYSIASSRKVVGDEVHVTVAQRADRRADRVAYGACSTALAQARPGASFQSWIEPNERFRLPADPGRDVIMIGPGTGVAPFRGFVQERIAVGASGRNWLVFGNRQLRCDFLYQTEWQDALKAGQLHRLTLAFSRDGERRTYVQQRLREQGAELYAWIAGGAHLYVCGDALAMAPAVDAALTEVLATHGGQSLHAATEQLQTLRSSGRYAQDVY